MSSSSISPIDRTLSSETIRAQFRAGNDGNSPKLQHSWILKSDCLISIPGLLLKKGDLALSRDAVEGIGNPNRLG